MQTASTLRQNTDIRQASLIDAALQLAAHRSPADITTSDLAASVGITQGAFFRHFPSKEAIWLAVMARVTDQLMGRLQAAAQLRNCDPSVSHPLAALQDVFIAHVDFVIAHPGVPRLVFQELQYSQPSALKAAVQNLMQQYRALVMGLLQQAQEQGLLNSDTDVPSATLLFLGSIQGLVMQSLINGQVQAIAQQAPGVFAILIRGIRNKET
jgi:TetR/AcrR family transcriptional regulator